MPNIEFLKMTKIAPREQISQKYYKSPTDIIQCQFQIGFMVSNLTNLGESTLVLSEVNSIVLDEIEPVRSLDHR